VKDADQEEQMRGYLIIVLATLCGGLFGPARGRTYHVPGDYSQIQDAIDAASDGDVVEVQPGTYFRAISFKGKGITVTGIAPEDSAVVAATVLDAACVWDDPLSVVSFTDHEDSTSVLAGLTLTGGYGTRLPHSGIYNSTGGGGIFCNGASPTILHCVIRNNVSLGRIVTRGGGGGVYCIDSSPKLAHCSVVANHAGDGGGISFNNSAATLIDCTIANSNYVSEGGGIYCLDSSPTLVDCTIIDNSTWNPGGGVYCSRSSPLFESCNIAENSSDTGAGLYFYDSSPTLINCTITANSSEWDGGGIYCDGSFATLTDCTIASNSADHDGGGILCDNSSPTLTNCTLAMNSAACSGGAFYCMDNSSPVLTNCILWNDVVDEIGTDSSAPEITYSDIPGGWPGEGNIDADPLFCDIRCGKFNDLGLAADSPCLGTGRDGADMGAWGQACDAPSEPHQPVTLEVPGEYATIADALAAACEQDTVLLAPGTYTGGFAVGSLGLVIRSWDPLDPEVVAATVISGGDDSVVRFLPHLRTLRPYLSGVTVRGSRIGILCDGSAPLIQYCTVTENTGNYIGAGLVGNYCAPTLTNCTIHGNSAKWRGGGGYFRESAPTIANSIIADNSARSDGGGIYLEKCSSTIDNCKITGNSAGKVGGGLAAARRSLTLTNCTIANNSASTGAGIGCSEWVIAQLSNCLLIENSATNHGGGALFTSSSMPTFTNCTIADNQASSAGGGIYYESNTLATLTNSILWKNRPGEIFADPDLVAATYCDVRGGWPGEGNIDRNPRFISWAGFVDLLAPSSACIDAGDPQLEDDIYDWHPRWPQGFADGPRSDMGAYGGPGNDGWLSELR
jgi:parallel beta-helix repeat protein